MLLRSDRLSNVAPILASAIRRMAAAMESQHGFDVVIAEAGRSDARQDELYAQGRTVLYDGNGAPLHIVTNARAGQSPHNERGGLSYAVDAYPSISGVMQLKRSDLQTLMGEWMEKNEPGITWGGHFHLSDGGNDPPHFEQDGWRSVPRARATSSESDLSPAIPFDAEAPSTKYMWPSLAMAGTAAFLLAVGGNTMRTIMLLYCLTGFAVMLWNTMRADAPVSAGKTYWKGLTDSAPVQMVSTGLLWPATLFVIATS